MFTKFANPRNIASLFLLLAGASLIAGCSQQLASIEDSYVPYSELENYPIKVVEKPVRLTVEASAQGVRQADIQTVHGFARAAAAQRGQTPVVIGYAKDSKGAQKAANQIAGIMVANGIARPSVVVTPQDGKGSEVVMSFAVKAAETKPCGNWDRNMRADNSNDVGPNFGCAYQQNIAAMVSNPSDFEHARNMPPTESWSQSWTFTGYANGTWTTPVQDSGIQASATSN